MATGDLARTDYRSRSTRPTALGVLVALVLFAAAFLAVLGLADRAGSTHGGPRGLSTAARWPSQGQAAIALGDGAPAASPDQEPAPIASLAKVMTAYLTLQRYPLGPGESGFTMTVSAAQAEAAQEEEEDGASVVAVEAGERLTEHQLLKALLIPSGNNVARMLADRVGGDEGSFVEEMNDAAEELGMDATDYTDPSGFDPDTASTAADQLRILQAAMTYPAFRRIARTETVTLPVAGTLVNFNPLIDAGYGGKTGSTSAAGGCLAFFTDVEVGGRRRTAVGVVMGQGSGEDTTSLLAAAGVAARRLVAVVAGSGGRGRGRP